MLRERVASSGRRAPRRRLRPGARRDPRTALTLTAVLLVAVCLAALAVGRYAVPLPHVVHILAAQIVGGPVGDQTGHDVVVLVRLPRILLAALVGGGLSVGGVALQAIFRNPLVSPQIIGVSSGASFGGALALFLGLGTTLLVGGAFAFGLLALGIVFLVTVGRTAAPMLTIVLGGVVTGSFFSALVSMLTYLANPYDTLPAIVFWLLGSVAGATFAKVLVCVVPVGLGLVVLLLLRWRINVLSLGDDDARSVGIAPGPVRWTVLAAVTLIVAGAVAVSGVISWVGLVVPHLARMWVGPDHRHLIPLSFLLGAAYLVAVDTLARSVTAGEIPLGVLTSLIGAPVFFALLRRHRDRVWDQA